MPNIPAALRHPDDGHDNDDEGMGERELESLVAGEVDDAVNFIDSDIGPKRALAMKYYRGDLFGNEEEGRSQVVSRDVSDTINAITPSLMRVFFGGENVVEFVPESKEDVALAEQQTDYVNYIVTCDNDGFEIIHAVVTDAVRSKVGIAKYWWDESTEVTTRRYVVQSEESFGLLEEDINKAYKSEVVEKTENEDGSFCVTMTLKRSVDRVKIEAVPPEEFLICRDAKSIDSARFVGHRREMTISDLVAMGYDRDLVIGLAGEDDDLETSEERLARTPWAKDGFKSDASRETANRTARYVEGYMLIDFDGDGIAELRNICTIGGKVVHNKPADERPFAAFRPDLEPHTFFPESIADKVMDLQKSKSALWRAGHDSLSASIFPRTVVGKRGGVEMDDVLNNEVGAVIRADDVTQVVTHMTPDVSGSALKWLAYADEVRENRTGMSKVSMGLDAEALQNTTATAAEGQFSRSQERIELVARILASGMKRLFRGISGLVAANQRKARTVRLRNKWVEYDPLTWRTDMDVHPNVALGGGSPQQRLSVLGLILGKQEMIFAQMGPQNPVCTLKQYADTLGKFVELAGFKNPDAFFRDPASEEVQAEQAAKAQQGPPPDPKMVEVQMKAQLAEQTAQHQAQMDAVKAEGSHQLETKKLQAQHEREMAKVMADAQLRRDQTAEELAMKRDQLQAEFDLREQQLRAEFALDVVKADHAAGMAERKAATSIGNPVEAGGEPG